MAMEPKTLENILDEVDAFHQRLVAHLRHCTEVCENEREGMLLDFVSDHEQWLSSSLEGFERTQYEGALNTWYYEYTDRHAILFSNPEEIPFDKMSYDEIAEKIRNINNEIIDLFEHLKGRSETKASEEAVDQMLTYLKANAKNLSQEIADTSGL